LNGYSYNGGSFEVAVMALVTSTKLSFVSTGIGDHP